MKTHRWLWMFVLILGAGFATVGCQSGDNKAENGEMKTAQVKYECAGCKMTKSVEEGAEAPKCKCGATMTKVKE